MHHIPEKIVSILFHPLWMPFYAFLLLENLHGTGLIYLSTSLFVRLAATVFIISALMPALLMILMWRLQIIESLSLHKPQEHSLPLLLTAVFFYLTYYVLNRLLLSPVFRFYLLGAILLTLISLFINLKWKISLHMVGAGSFFGMLLGISILFDAQYIWYAIVAVLLSGIIGVCRLRLSTHKPIQIYAGFVLGAALMFLLFEFVRI